MPEPSKGQLHSLLRGTAIVSLLTQLSRVLGFVREMLTARLLGAGFFADAFVAAFRIPNLLRSFLAEGALTSAFVPVFSDEIQKSREAAKLALHAIAGFLVCCTTALSLLGVLYAPAIVAAVAPGFADEKRDLCVLLTRIMVPYIILVSLVALLNGALNAVRHFGSGAWAQVLMNVVLISGAAIAFAYPKELAPLFLSWSVLLGGIIGILSQLPALKRTNLTFGIKITLRSPALREVAILMIPAVFGAAVYQINIVLQTVFASLLREGSVSWIYYADRLGQLPIGVFTVALGSVLLPTLSDSKAKGDEKHFLKSLGDALRYTTFLMIPLALFLALFAEPLFRLFLEGGAFSKSDSHASASALQAMTIGLWAVSCYSIAMKAFVAKKDTLTPALFGLLSLFLSCVFSIMLMGSPVTEEQSGAAALIRHVQNTLSPYLPEFNLGHVGLCLSSSFASIVSLAMLALLFRKRFPAFSWTSFISATVKSSIAATVPGLLFYFTSAAELSPILQLVVVAPAAVVLFLITSLLLRSEEAWEIKSLVTRKLLARSLR